MDDVAAQLRREYFVDEAGAKAFHEAFARLVAEHLKKVVAQYMSPENTHRFRHGGKWVHPGAPEAMGGELRQHSAVFETQFQNLVDNDLSIISRNTENLLAAMHRQFAMMLYSTVSAVCEQTGNTVDAKAAGSMESALLEMIEKIELAVDRNGEVKLPELHAGPEAAARLNDAMSSMSPEFKQRFDDLLRRKGEEALAREAQRKAKFARYGDGV